MKGEQFKELEIKPYTKLELCRLYKVGVKSMSKWLVPIKNKLGKKWGRYYTVHQVRMIVEHIGIPSTISIE